MLLLVLLLVPTVLAAESDLKIGNYLLKVDDNILKSILNEGDESTELDLSGLGFRAIENKNVFDNLEHVKNLNLANNSLSALPEFVFSNLTSLVNLSLANNRIEAFENAFVGLNNLENLNISNNPMKHLRKSFFFGLTKLSDVITRGNAFLSMSTELFENPFLRTEPLPQPLAKEAPATEDIATESEVKRTKREATLPLEPVFDKDLRVKLCLQEDSVKSLEILKKDEALASDCKEVEVDYQVGSLSLNGLGISKFEKGWYRLEGLPAHTLKLDGNSIVRITSELLNDLPENVRHVSLADNKIERLEKGIIENEHLQNLNLKGNFISEIEDGALEKTKLTALYIANNRLTDTKFVASLPPTLTQMVLLKNALTEISADSFSKLNQLLYLNLAENNITELQSQSLRGLSSLQALDIKKSGLSKIAPSAFQDLKSLTLLDLSNNYLSSLEKGEFDGLLKIERLYIGYNKLKNIGKESLHGLSDSLSELTLNSNELETLEAGTFVNRPKQLLSLQGNRISKIEKGAFDLPDLLDLRLEDNLLKNLDGDSFEGLSSLRHLSLKANGIANIEKGAAKNLGSLFTLDISSNPIKMLENGALFGLQKSRGSHVHLADVPVEIIQGGLFDDV